jgi:hypothetical protein
LLDDLRTGRFARVFTMFSPLQDSSIENNGSQQAPPEQERECDPAARQDQQQHEPERIRARQARNIHAVNAGDQRQVKSLMTSSKPPSVDSTCRFSSCSCNTSRKAAGVPALAVDSRRSARDRRQRFR